MAYDRINWENTPSHVTPLSAENLNTMDEAIDNIDEELNRVGVKAVNLEARMDTAETNIVGIGEELTEQDTYAKGMGTKTLQHETDIATLKSQVTQIIDGGPASPSELTDVRISENGTAYPTAGEAVRAQVRQMIEVQDTQPTDPGNKLWINDGSYDSEDHQVPTWEEFSELKNDLNYGLTFDFVDWKQGALTITGEEVTSSKVVRTDFIDIDSFVSLYKPVGVWGRYCYYDSSKVFIEQIQASYNIAFTDYRNGIKTNHPTAKYIRLAFSIYEGRTQQITNPTNILETGYVFKRLYSVDEINTTVFELIADVSALNDNLYVDGLTLTNETKVFTVPSGNNRNKNSIITVFAMYTQADGVTDTPYISVVRSWLGSDNRYHDYYGSGRYELGQKGNYKQTQIRLAPLVQSTKETKINVVVPEGVTLHIKYLSLDYSDMISREDNGIHLNAHGSSGFGGPAQTNIQWEMAARLGYQYCITIPKVTSDGVYVCLHDDDSIQATARNDDGSQIASEYRDRPVSDFTYNQLLQFDFGILRGRPFAGERIPLLEDFFKTCSKTGMHPMLSVHPSLSGHWDNIKALAKKYGVLNKLNIKSDATNIEVPMAALLDDIESYTIDDSTGESRVTRFNTLTERYTLNKARKVIEYNYSVITDALISDVLNNGYLCGCFNYGYDSRIVKSLMDKGVTEFTEDYNCSVGLNW